MGKEEMVTEQTQLVALLHQYLHPFSLTHTHTHTTYTHTQTRDRIMGAEVLLTEQNQLVALLNQNIHNNFAGDDAIRAKVPVKKSIFTKRDLHTRKGTYIHGKETRKRERTPLKKSHIFTLKESYTYLKRVIYIP